VKPGNLGFQGFVLGRVGFNRTSRIPEKCFACTCICIDCVWIELDFHLVWSIALGIGCAGVGERFTWTKEMSPKVVDRRVFGT